jgi:hypothetical protein
MQDKAANTHFLAAVKALTVVLVLGLAHTVFVV